MRFDITLKDKLDQRVDSFIKEMRPKNGNIFTYSELMPKYENCLQEFSKLVYGEIDNDFINEYKSELNLSPAVRDSTDGTDEILTSILDVEIAKIIYQHGLNKDKLYQEVDDGRESMRRAMIYLLEPNHQSNKYKKLFSHLGDYIYNNNSQSNFSQSSGCLIIFIIFTGIVSTILRVALY